ncbi:MAG: DUF2207 domain-containing protein [Clostridia bacterium]|nr:DUF2207 domain-containing protein [Clostridia bacterium]
MFFLFAFCETVIIAGLILLMAVFTPPAFALIVSVAMLLAVYIFRPAGRLDRAVRRDRRRVLRRFRPKPVPDGITMRPQDSLSPAEVFRLMEIVGMVPAERRAVADFTATLLDLNRRGLVALSQTAGEDLLRGDGMRAAPRRDLDPKKLRRHEQILIAMLKHASGPAASVQLSAFYDSFTRFPVLSQRKTDAFRRSVDKLLKRRGMIARANVGERKFPYLLGRRVWVLTQKGEQSAAYWKTYYRNVCNRPFVDSYRPNTADQKRFAVEINRILVDAAACGCAARAAESLQREYIFDPLELWHDGQYFSTMTESRTAFSGTNGGEAYFFLPLRDFEAAVAIAVERGMPQK